MVTRPLIVAVIALVLTLTRTAQSAEPKPPTRPPAPATTPATPPAAPVSTPTPAPSPTPSPTPTPPPAQIEPRPPVVFHAPLSSLEAAAGFALDARVLDSERLAELWVELRPALSAIGHAAFDRFGRVCLESKGSFDEATQTCRLELRRRATPEVYGVDIDGELVQPPGLAYALYTRDTADHIEAVFTSREAPFTTLVNGESEASRRADRVERHRGHTSQIALRTELSFFGPSRPEALDATVRTDPYSDMYGSVELEYTSRPLRGIYAFRMGLGVMRGQRATYEDANGSQRSVAEGPQPGLNYGYGELVFEVSRLLYLTPRLTLGASEAGFSAGVGAEATIGRPTSTRLELGVDWVSGLGTRGWLTFAWTTVKRFPMGLTVELTGLPDEDSNPTGSRLLYDLGVEFSDAFALGLRVGYAQRSTAFDGGLVSGLNATLDF